MNEQKGQHIAEPARQDRRGPAARLPGQRRPVCPGRRAAAPASDHGRGPRPPRRSGTAVHPPLHQRRAVHPAVSVREEAQAADLSCQSRSPHRAARRPDRRRAAPVTAPPAGAGPPIRNAGRRAQLAGGIQARIDRMARGPRCRAPPARSSSRPDTPYSRSSSQLDPLPLQASRLAGETRTSTLQAATPGGVSLSFISSPIASRKGLSPRLPT